VQPETGPLHGYTVVELSTGIAGAYCTKTAAFELAPHGIRVNAIAPDFTVTEGLMQLSREGLGPEVSQAIPLVRAGDVDEIASTAVFLARKWRAISPGRPFTSTGEHRPLAAGTTTAPATTSSGQTSY
jgi:NAD(P)-dependent dehydrogenase (short-subunit alcohol dehydrogenase family)